MSQSNGGGNILARITICSIVGFSPGRSPAESGLPASKRTELKVLCLGDGFSKANCGMGDPTKCWHGSQNRDGEISIDTYSDMEAWLAIRWPISGRSG